MRKLAVLAFVTLDGVMQAPSVPEEDRSRGFRQGGWARPYWDEVMQSVGGEAMSAPYDMLFGRKTYEIFAGHWPTAPKNDPGAAMMNHATKYVATKTLTAPSWENSHVLDGDVVEAVARLKREDGSLLQIHGSQNLIQTLLAHRLIDEFRLWIFPVVVGSGKRLFETPSAAPNLMLVKSRVLSNGVVMGFYRVSEC
ncbi:MAG: dihydrofolate reductase family protein [Pseudomonadota bacterium]